MDEKEYREAIRNLTLTDEMLDRHRKDVIEAAEKKPKLKKNLDLILRGINLVEKSIKRNDARKSAFCMGFLFSLLIEFGHFKPSYLEWASKKPKPRKEKGFFRAIEYAWDHSKRKTALSIWDSLIKACDKDMFAVKTGIDLIYERKENKLYYYHPDGKSRRIGFRAFQKYFSEFKKKSQ